MDTLIRVEPTAPPDVASATVVRLLQVELRTPLSPGKWLLRKKLRVEFVWIFAKVFVFKKNISIKICKTKPYRKNTILLKCFFANDMNCAYDDDMLLPPKGTSSVRLRRWNLRLGLSKKTHWFYGIYIYEYIYNIYTCFFVVWLLCICIFRTMYICFFCFCPYVEILPSWFLHLCSWHWLRLLRLCSRLHLCLPRARP